MRMISMAKVIPTRFAMHPAATTTISARYSKISRIGERYSITERVGEGWSND